MLAKDGIHFVACCDFCPDTFDTGEAGWQDAIDAMKREGWRIFPEGREWRHKCPACDESPSSDDFSEAA